jgi:hypothetical protein
MRSVRTEVLMSAALDYATTRAKREWGLSHSRGPSAWLFRRLGAMRAIGAVWICQHTDGDWARADCMGQPERVWRYDDSGLKQVDRLPELDKSAIASTTPVIRFCLNETVGRMIYVEWHGLRAAFGAIMALNKDGQWIVEKDAWRS